MPIERKAVGTKIQQKKRLSGRSPKPACCKKSSFGCTTRKSKSRRCLSLRCLICESAPQAPFFRGFHPTSTKTFFGCFCVHRGRNRVTCLDDTLLCRSHAPSVSMIKLESEQVRGRRLESAMKLVPVLLPGMIYVHSGMPDCNGGSFQVRSVDIISTI